MEKYISEKVKAEDLIIKTESIWKSDDTRLFRVEIKHAPSNIKIHKYRYSQMEAYNVCIEQIEWTINAREFRKKYEDRLDLFAEDYLGIKLLPHQRLLLRNIDKIDINKSFMG